MWQAGRDSATIVRAWTLRKNLTSMLRGIVRQVDEELNATETMMFVDHNGVEIDHTLIGLAVTSSSRRS